MTRSRFGDWMMDKMVKYHEFIITTLFIIGHIALIKSAYDHAENHIRIYIASAFLSIVFRYLTKFEVVQMLKLTGHS